MILSNVCSIVCLQEQGVYWASLFGIIIWLIWKNKNLFIFQNITWTAFDIIKASESWARQFEASQNASKLFLQTHISKDNDETWVHLFIDGAMERDTEKAATGGIIGDMDGNWLLSFNHYLGNCTPFEAELWGIMDEIFIMLKNGYKRATIQTNNLEVAQILTGKTMEDTCITILRRTQKIMSFDGQWQIRYIPREKNLVTDRLAKLCLLWKSTLQTFDKPPKEMLETLQHDLDCTFDDILIWCNWLFLLKNKKIYKHKVNEKL